MSVNSSWATWSQLFNRKVIQDVYRRSNNNIPSFFTLQRPNLGTTNEKTVPVLKIKWYKLLSYEGICVILPSKMAINFLSSPKEKLSHDCDT